jgi:hypothetical protein
MSDKLEKFIRENKASFDVREPSESLWNRISSILFRGRGILSPLSLWRAAAVLFMALSAYLIYPKLQEEKAERIVMNEFQPVEEFYIKQISDKVDLIEEFRGGEPGLNGFTADFQQLEAMYFVLKEEMKSSPSQKVKDALVLNLLVRIDLLNQQLYKLEQSKAGESEVKDPEVNT